jgi:D-glycero-alpha-D-manno-heptose 1-phosphate guanylyltransferase
MSMSIDTGFILAGGLGTRLRKLVSDVPKPMALVNSKPFLWHLFRYWENQGIRRFIVSIGYKGHVIQDYFGRSFGTAQIDYVLEESPLGTGGALLNCLSAHPQSKPFVLLNGDTYFEVDLFALNKRGTECKADWCLTLFPTNEKSRYLLFQINIDGTLSYDFSHQSTNIHFSDSKYANGGVYWINPASLDRISSGSFPFSLENELLESLIKAGRRIVGYRSDGPFIDIGLPADYQRSQNLPFFCLS